MMASASLLVTFLFLFTINVQSAEDLDSVVSRYRTTNVALKALQTYNCWVETAKGTGCAGATPQDMKSIISDAITDCKDKAMKVADPQRIALFKTCADQQLTEYANNLQSSSEQVRSCTGKNPNTCA